MILSIIAIILGFGGLIWSADQFVSGAAGIARNMGMAPIMIGLTIVALGTSAPEILVAISASIENSGDLAVGNAIGSNLANIGLVLGITALIAPITIPKTLLRREIPILVAVTLAAALLLQDHTLSVMDGIILLTILTGVFLYLIYSKSHQPDAEHEAGVEDIPDMAQNKAWLLFVVGLVLLIISSEVLVWGAKDIATAMGVSELIIGLTVVAVGTSLPELAATIASALKGHHDLALGNVVGSNLFNLLAVMAVPALIQQPVLAAEAFNRDYLSMTGITLLLAILVYVHLSLTKNDGIKRITRAEGGLLFFCYAAYYYFLFG